MPEAFSKVSSLMMLPFKSSYYLMYTSVHYIRGSKLFEITTAVYSDKLEILRANCTVFIF